MPSLRCWEGLLLPTWQQTGPRRAPPLMAPHGSPGQASVPLSSTNQIGSSATAAWHTPSTGLLGKRGRERKQQSPHCGKEQTREVQQWWPWNGRPAGCLCPEGHLAITGLHSCHQVHWNEPPPSLPVIIAAPISQPHQASPDSGLYSTGASHFLQRSTLKILCILPAIMPYQKPQ